MATLEGWGIPDRIKDDEGKRTQKWSNLLKNLAPHVRKSLHQEKLFAELRNVAKAKTLRQTVSFNIVHLPFTIYRLVAARGNHLRILFNDLCATTTVAIRHGIKILSIVIKLMIIHVMLGRWSLIQLFGR